MADFNFNNPAPTPSPYYYDHSHAHSHPRNHLDFHHPSPSAATFHAPQPAPFTHPLHQVQQPLQQHPLDFSAHQLQQQPPPHEQSLLHQQQQQQPHPSVFAAPPLSQPDPSMSTSMSTATTIDPPKPRRGRRSAKQAAQQASVDHTSFVDASSALTGSTSSAPPPRRIEIKTKFPVARIKRIMQADEDVGKVAQVTPVVVSKALELFMIALTDKASVKARARSSRRITAAHLKAAIKDEDQFDFLADLIEKIPDAPQSTDANNGDSPDEAAATPVRKTRKPRQKKAAKNDDALQNMEA